jgi:hypothetical protein
MKATRLVGAAFGAAATLILAPDARADVLCGTAPATWNVPPGDIALTQAEGPVKAVLTAVGEYRSHSMLSSPNGYVTHATSVVPHLNGDESPYWTPFCSSCGSECWNPLDPEFLHNSTPGLEQVQAGAIYAFLYEGGTNNYLAYQRAPQTTQGNAWQTAISNLSWNLGEGMSSAWFGSGSDGTSGGDGSHGFYGLAYNGTRVHYGWNQYMNLQGAAQGVPGSDNGLVCSTSLAMWQHDALNGTPGYTGDVAPRTYSNASISNGANALYNAVQAECQSQIGWFSSVGSFFSNLGWQALCVGSGESDPCSAAADQMVDCFAAGNCGNTSSAARYWQGQWHSVVSNGATATSISPDDIGCWNSNGTGAPCTGNGSSVWGGDVAQTVLWNSGGNQYSCWD